MPIPRYFLAKRNLEATVCFKALVGTLWTIEDECAERLRKKGSYFRANEFRDAIKSASISDSDGRAIREEIAKGIENIKRIANGFGLPTIARSLPAPMVGGYVIPQQILDCVLQDTSYQGVERSIIWDLLNRTIGECERVVEREWKRTCNPLAWAMAGLEAVIRIPFVLLSMSGFDVSKAEDHLFAKLFKVLEIVAIIVFLFWIGFNRNDILTAIGKLFGK